MVRTKFPWLTQHFQSRTFQGNVRLHVKRNRNREIQDGCLQTESGNIEAFTLQACEKTIQTVNPHDFRIQTSQCNYNAYT